ncbi:hypothetical protein CPC08DRAFT_702545 [Agrocybe pediades]|nr:hypothetical protein CPC08DRAFT_702545 [Agrocybe pediades]
MSKDPTVPLLSRALHRIRTIPPRIISSPATQPRRAAVALIIRVVPSPTNPPPANSEKPPTLSEFFAADWVNDPNARAELLFLHRENTASVNDASMWQAKVSTSSSASSSRHSSSNTTEAHVAFPGGRQEPDDEGALYTAMRQTWEEIGIDLAEPCYTCIGQLDDREITTSLGKRLLMILSPFVFLQLTPPSATPPPDPVESTTLHWTPLASLVSLSEKDPPRWSTVTVDAASRLAPRHSAVLKFLVRVLIGSMQFPAIVLQTSSPSVNPSQTLKLWGLSLGMTLDLLSYMILPSPKCVSLSDEKLSMSGLGVDEKQGGRRTSAPSSPLTPLMQLPYQPVVDDFRMEFIAPSLASVFPRFSYPDVNFWIWVFGKRYREVIRGWEASVRDGGTNDRRINWSGSALNTFYAAIRKALVVVIVARALGILFGVSFALWWIFS